MSLTPPSSIARDGDLAELVGLRHKHFILNLQAGAKFETHRGILLHDDLIGKPWGTQVFSHMGRAVLPPAALARRSAHRHPAHHADPLPEGHRLHPRHDGSRAGAKGDGGGHRLRVHDDRPCVCRRPEGRVISYEVKQDVQNLARKNLTRFGLDSRVDFKLRDIQEGFDETDADSFFLDVQNPYDYIRQVRAALKPGGFLCCLIPTFNQVEKTLYALRQFKFAFIEVCEILLRYYKPEPSRMRPVDRMVAHTGFLVFARRIEPSEDPRGRELAKEVGEALEEETNNAPRVPPPDSKIARAGCAANPAGGELRLLQGRIWARRRTLRADRPRRGRARRAARAVGPSSDGFSESRMRRRASSVRRCVPLVWQDEEWHVLFTRRTDRVESHKGQVSFPGGACDDGETTPEQTALREAEEEIGINPADVRVLGQAQPMITVSSFRVSPVVGVMKWPYAFKVRASKWRASSPSFVVAGKSKQLLGVFRWAARTIR
jgi:tRNA (adenine57-N1/adenine58-N1)-methyltransferase catalytic subunit